jgi:hypothetical protein
VPSGRPRRRFFNRKSVALAAVIACSAAFYAGISVEKGQLPSTSSAATTNATAAAPRSGTAAGGAGAPGGFAGRFGGGAGGAGGANASLGTISSVSGNTIYLTDPTGNTVKVTLPSSAKLTKSLRVSKSSLHPGDTIVVQGVKNSSGTIVATSVSDSGASASRGGGSTSSSAGGTNASSSTTATG